jgi:hypothetical protein
MNTFDAESKRIVFIVRGPPIVFCVTERGANADGRADRAERDIEAPRAPREIGDHEDCDDAEDSSAHTVEDLDRDEEAVSWVSV